MHALRTGKRKHYTLDVSEILPLFSCQQLLVGVIWFLHCNSYFNSSLDVGVTTPFYAAPV